MSEEKPLHVRVAEALGAHCHYTKPTDPCVTCGNEGPPGGWELTGWGHGIDFDPEEFDKEVPRYDTDWSATGPLIEKYWISVMDDVRGTDLDRRWQASHWPDGSADNATEEWGPTPLIAVCNLLLALHSAGKLQR